MPTAIGIGISPMFQLGAQLNLWQNLPEGLVLHVDPSTKLSVYEENTLVTESVTGAVIGGIVDISGIGNNGRQVTTINKPILAKGKIKSTSVKSFDLIGSKALEFPSLFGNACTALTFIAVIRPISRVNGTVWMLGNGDTSGGGDYIYLYTAVGAYTWRVMANNGGNYIDYDTGIKVSLNPQFTAVRWDNTTIKVDIDGETFSAVAAVGAINTSVRNTIGALHDGIGTDYIAGYYQEMRCYGIMAFDRAITDLELTDVKSRYSTQLGLPFGNYYINNNSPAIGVSHKNFCPQIVRCVSGKLIVVVTVYTNDVETSPSAVISYNSDNLGTTWSQLAVIVDGNGDNKTVNNGAFLRLSNGNLVCTYYKQPAAGFGDVSMALGYCKISVDDGVSWGNEIYMGDLLGVGKYWNPYTSGVVCDNGTILVSAFSAGLTINKNFLAKSVDGGNTWSMIPVLTGNNNVTNTPYSELAIAKNGSKIVGLVKNAVIDGFERLISYDNGETWSAPTVVIINDDAFVIGFPAITYDGNLLKAYSRSWDGFYKYSWDDGLTWTISDQKVTPINPIELYYNFIHVLVDSGRRYVICDKGDYNMLFYTSASGAWI